MRRPPSLGALFPTIRGELLAALLTQPDRWWYLSELAHFLETAPSSLQRELRSLVAGGILEQRREGGRAYFKAETRSPLFPELRGLLEKTAGVVPALQRMLAAFGPDIDFAFAYGSVARNQERALSDVDLMVVGRTGVAELAPALRQVETRLGREINVTSYSAAEFRKKVAAGDHFLSTVLRGPKNFVKGSQRDLDRVIGKPRRTTSSHLQKGTR
jgi:predicted nucleotidyltransferase